MIQKPPPIKQLTGYKLSGVWRSAMTQPGWVKMAGRAEHIRSHQLDAQPQLLTDSSISHGLKHKLLGNKLADEAADAAHAQHMPYHRERFMIDQKAHRAAQAVVELAARLLPLHPRRARHARASVAVAGGIADLAAPSQAEAEDSRATDGLQSSSSTAQVLPPTPSAPTTPPTVPCPPAAPEAPGETARRHEWREIRATPGSWRCLSCGTVANTGQVDSPTEAGCTGVPKVLLHIGSGHRLLRYRAHPQAAEQMQCFACTICHRTATSQPIFKDECDGVRTASRTCSFNRLEKGRHPHSRWGTKLLFTAGEFLPLLPAIAP